METQLDNNKESDDRRLGGIFLIIGWAIGLGLVGLLVHYGMFSTKAPSITETHAGTKIIIQRDYDSHFRIAGSINGIKVTFLIDTGASSIALSDEIADRAKLERKATIETETANGNAVGYLTRINKVIIAGIDMNDVSAIIVPNMNSEALLGMNVLKNFNIEQTATTLTLTIPAAATSP